MQGYTDHDATALGEMIRTGKVSAREVVDAAIEAVESVNPRLNAVVHRMYEAARKNAQSESHAGVFAGVPFVVKDLDGLVEGVPYTQSSRMTARFVPDHDCELIARMRKTGVILLAKTNTPELGIFGVTESELHGACRNPWNLDHTPGGSSGGTAALVAARAVPMGHGGDGGGSIRIPSSACGLFGLKPTRGRQPLGPDAGEGWSGYVSPGVITRSVRDCAHMLDATQGADVGAPYWAPPIERPYAQEILREPGKLRIAFTTKSLFGRETHPDCVAAVQDAARLCASLGHEVTEAAPVLNKQALVRAYLVTVAAGVSAGIEQSARWARRAPSPDGFEAPTWMLGQIARALPLSELQRARDEAQSAGRTMGVFHTQYDLFLCPTMAYPPARVGELAMRAGEKFGLRVLRMLPLRGLLDRVLTDMADKSLERTPNTQLFNQTGQPAMSVPLCVNPAGLPIGVQFAAKFGDEAMLFRLAAQLEKSRPWAMRRPGVCA